MNACFSQHYQQRSMEGVPLAVQDFCNKSFENFQKVGIPNRSVESWKYTNLKFLQEEDWLFANDSNKNIAKLESYWRDLPTNANRLVLVNGSFEAGVCHFEDPSLEKWVIPIDIAWKQHSEAIMSALKISMQEPSDALVSLNHAFLRKGYFLKIPQGEKLKNPVYVIHIQNEGNLHSTTAVIDLAQNSEIEVIEKYSGSNGYFHNVATHINLAENSQLRRTQIVEESNSARHTGHSFVKLKRDSHFQSLSLSVNGKMVRQFQRIHLLEANASVRLDGLSIIGSGQHHDQCSQINHTKGHTTSSQMCKKILYDKSRGVFNGQINVHEKAAKSLAYQMNKNLLLGDGAEIDTRPQLQIDNDDVKCVHGATVGQLEAKELFYLQSRGISREQAHSLLCLAFTEEVLQPIENKALKTYLQSLVKAKL